MDGSIDRSLLLIVSFCRWRTAGQNSHRKQNITLRLTFPLFCSGRWLLIWLFLSLPVSLSFCPLSPWFRRLDRRRHRAREQRSMSKPIARRRIWTSCSVFIGKKHRTSRDHPPRRAKERHQPPSFISDLNFDVEAAGTCSDSCLECSRENETEETSLFVTSKRGSMVNRYSSGSICSDRRFHPSAHLTVFSRCFSLQINSCLLITRNVLRHPTRVCRDRPQPIIDDHQRHPYRLCTHSPPPRLGQLRRWKCPRNNWINWNVFLALCITLVPIYRTRSASVFVLWFWHLWWVVVFSDD